MNSRTRSSAAGGGVPLYARMLRSMWTMRGTFATPANTLLLTPIQIPFRLTINRLGVMVNVGAGNVRMGIYADNGNTPDGGALLSETAAGAPVAMGKFEIALPANLQLQRGLYWLVINNNNAALELCQAVAPQQSGGTLFGRRAATAFGAMPNPCPASAANVAAVMYCMVVSVP